MNHTSKLVVFLSLVIGNILYAQSPCTGTPGANTISPISQTICAGSSINLGLANSYSTSGFTFQWQSSTVSVVGPFTSISGATLHTYATPGLPMTTFFNVIITCTNSGLSISVPYSVTIVPCNVPCTGTPAVSSILPNNATVCIGSNTVLSLSNTYTETGIAYQWLSASSLSGPYTAVSGATMSTFLTPTLATNGYYQVVITCTNTNASYTTTQMVTAVPCAYYSGPPASNTIIPTTATVCAGSSTTLSLANTYSASGYTYQWQQSTVSQVGPFQNVSNATSSILTTPNLTNTTYYNIVITCTNGGQNISISKAVTVINCNVPCSGTPPTNSVLPLTASLCAGNGTLLSLATTYSQTGYSYQWGFSNAASGPYTAIAAATQSTYTTPLLNNNAYYNVIITCTNSGMNTSATRSIQIVPCVGCSGTPASNVILPISSTICVGASVTLSLATTYSTTGYTYQWQSSTVSPVGPFTSVSGATASVYTATNITITTYFNLIITCTNSSNSISISQVVYVVPCTNGCNGTPATTNIVPGTQTLCAGNSAFLSLSNTYTASGISIQWGSGSSAAGPFTAIPGATLASYSTPNLSSNGFYNVVITCINGGQTVSATSTIGVVNCNTCVGTPGSNTILPINHTVCIGAPITLSLANTYTGSGYTYQWQSSTTGLSGPYTAVAGATASVLSLPNLANTTYFKLVVTCIGGGNSLTLTQVVYLQSCAVVCSGAPPNNTILPITHTLCAGNSASMSLANTYTTTGITYQWETANTAAGPFTSIPGATLISFVSPTLNATAFYNAVITCTAGGLNTRVSHTVTVLNCNSTIGVQEEKAALQKVVVIPNPNSGLFTVVCARETVKRIFVLDIAGRVLYTAFTREQSVQMDLQYLQSGIYTLVVETEHLQTAIKLVKE